MALCELLLTLRSTTITLGQRGVSLSRQEAHMCVPSKERVTYFIRYTQQCNLFIYSVDVQFFSRLFISVELFEIHLSRGEGYVPLFWCNPVTFFACPISRT